MLDSGMLDRWRETCCSRHWLRWRSLAPLTTGTPRSSASARQQAWTPSSPWASTDDAGAIEQEANRSASRASACNSASSWTPSSPWASTDDAGVTEQAVATAQTKSPPRDQADVNKAFASAMTAKPDAGGPHQAVDGKTATRLTQADVDREFGRVLEGREKAKELVRRAGWPAVRRAFADHLDKLALKHGNAGDAFSTDGDYDVVLVYDTVMCSRQLVYKMMKDMRPVLKQLRFKQLECDNAAERDWEDVDQVALELLPPQAFVAFRGVGQQRDFFRLDQATEPVQGDEPQDEDDQPHALRSLRLRPAGFPSAVAEPSTL